MISLRAALLALTLSSAAFAAGTADAYIPPVEGTTLAGEHVSLPADLGRAGQPLSTATRPTVLILGFSRDASAAARDWGKRLADDPDTNTSEPYFVMPVLTGVPRFLRGAVLHAIAHDVSDRGKHHFLPITTDEARWRDLAGYHEPGAAYLLVVSASGEVVWRTSAPLSDTTYAELQQHLRSANPS